MDKEAGKATTNENTDSKRDLTQAEYNNFRRMFRTFDHDGSGAIDRNELEDVMRALGYKLTAEQITEAIQQYGGDDGLDFKGFLSVLLGIRAKNQTENEEAILSTEHIGNTLRTKRLLPDEAWRWALDFFNFFGIAYYMLVVPMRDVRTDWRTRTNLGASSAWIVWECIFTVAGILDVVLNFFTLQTSADGQEDIEDLAGIARH